ncbi:MAG: HhH-GPD-type base excision DNA repair protein [Acidimicrobiales bacterium]
MADLHLAQDPEADRLLSDDPLALLIGMVLDQQIPLERAFRSPFDLAARLETGLDAGALAAMDPDVLASMFATPPALHRFPASMSRRVQELCALVAGRYGGRAERIWLDAADGEALLRRVRELPGFGEQKARIFVALLGKRLGVAPPGWREASAPFGDPGSLMSVADIDGPETLAEVRRHKAEMKAAGKAAAGPPATPSPGVPGGAAATGSRDAAPAPRRG